MTSMKQELDHLVDCAIGMLSSVWPRSMARREVSRLSRAGYTLGTRQDFQFSLSLEHGRAEAALRAVEAAGFRQDRAVTTGPHYTVNVSMPLTAYRLHITTSKLQRLLAPFGGFAVAIGPMMELPRTLEDRQRAAAVPGRDRLDVPDHVARRTHAGMSQSVPAA